MSKEIILGGISFKTKKEITSFVYSVFEKLGKDKNIYPTDNFFVFFFDLLKRHPEFDEKTKNGISCFKLGSNQMHSHVELQVLDIEGKDQPFNWKTCISGKSKNRDLEIYEAMRSSVIHQIDFFSFRNTQPTICPMCKKQKDSYHVDHVVPFKLLADEFISKYGKPSEFSKMKCYLTTFKAEDLNYQKTWIDFHKEKAHLQWLCASCNMSKGKKIISL